MNYLAGALIQLKSGGPLMTVKETFLGENGETLYRAQWFDGKTLCEGIFLHDTVEYEGE
ncbi:DUF2158 domain-containing protein [Serratia marcescens]|uniref:DUF2158 domain-containing protein n=1 Tax=Serratia marcescens TaxID=615 RepID=UPI003ED96A22